MAPPRWVPYGLAFLAGGWLIFGWMVLLEFVARGGR